MKKILVTGGAGFIGSHLTENLLNQGHHVFVVDDESTGKASNLPSSATRDGPGKLEYRRGSVGDAELVSELVDQCEEVYHLAAAVGVALIAKQPIATIERNIYPTQLILAECLKRHQAQRPIRLFVASTSEVYGKNPKPVWSEEDDLVFGSTTKARWSYGASKAIDEFLALAYWRQYQLPIVIARFFNVVGPRQTGAYGMVLPRFVEAAVAARPLVVHDDGQQVRCFAHVADVVGAVLKLMETPHAVGRVFNIGSDRAISILELAELVIRMAGSSAEVQFQSYTDAYDKDFEDIRRRVPDLTRLKEAIGFEPQHSLEQIVEGLIGLARS